MVHDRFLCRHLTALPSRIYLMRINFSKSSSASNKSGESGRETLRDAGSGGRSCQSRRCG